MLVGVVPRRAKRGLAISGRQLARLSKGSPMSAGESLKFRESVLLAIVVAIGAAIGGLIGSVVTSYVQARYQREQLLMERRLVAIKDYSACYYRLATEILPKFEAFRSLFSEETKASREKRPDDAAKLHQQELAACDEVRRQANVWTADMNTQTTIVNALFHTQYKLSGFVFTPKAETNAKHDKVVTDAAGEGDLSKPKAAVERARSALERAGSAPDLARSEAERARSKVEIALLQLEFDSSKLDLARSEADLARSEAERARSQLAIDSSKLELSRSKVAFGLSKTEADIAANLDYGEVILESLIKQLDKQ